jgi:hypothetical protein
MEKPSLPSIKYILGDVDPILNNHHTNIANGKFASSFSYTKSE